MKIETGKTYLTNCGLMVNVITTDGYGDYPIIGAYLDRDKWIPAAWTAEGEFRARDYKLPEPEFDIYLKEDPKPEYRYIVEGHLENVHGQMQDEYTTYVFESEGQALAAMERFAVVRISRVVEDNTFALGCDDCDECDEPCGECNGSC